MKKLLGFLLVIGILAALLLPKLIGSQGTKVHDQYFKDQARLLIPGVTVESETLEDGWFKSNGVHRVKLSEAFVKRLLPNVENVKFNKEFDLLVTSTIHHGPFAFTSLGSKGASLSPVAAVSESTFQIETPEKTFDLPGTLFTQVSPTGDGGKAIYVIDEYQKSGEDGDVNFSGLDIEFDIDDRGKVIDSEGQAGTLSIQGKNGGEIYLSNLDFSADLKNPYGVWFGLSDMTLEEVRISDSSGAKFSIENVSMDGGNKGNAEQFDAVGEFKIGEFVVSDMKFEDFTFNYSFERLDTKASARISDVANNNPVAVQAELLKEMKNLIAHSPRFKINELSLKTPGGKIYADMDLGLPENVDMTFFPLSLLPQIKGDGLVKIPETVIPFLNQIKPGLGGQIEFLGQMGLLEKDGNDYVANLSLADGQLSVNGNPVPLSQMF